MTGDLAAPAELFGERDRVGLCQREAVMSEKVKRGFGILPGLAENPEQEMDLQ